jgi:hypothetical protein
MIGDTILPFSVFAKLLLYVYAIYMPNVYTTDGPLLVLSLDL